MANALTPNQVMVANRRRLPQAAATAGRVAPATVTAPAADIMGTAPTGVYSNLGNYGLPGNASAWNAGPITSTPTGFGTPASVLPASSPSMDPGAIYGSSQATPGFTADFSSLTDKPAGFTGGFSDISNMSDLSAWGKNSGLLDNIDSKGIKTQGMLGAGFGVAQGIGNAYFAMKNYGLAKDTFNENKRQYDQNYNMQKDLTYAALADRQNGRHRNNPTTQASWEDYKKANLSQA